MCQRALLLAPVLAFAVTLVPGSSSPGPGQCPLFQCPACEGECNNTIVWTGPAYAGCCGEVEPPCHDACREGWCASWTMDDGECTHVCESRYVVFCVS